MKDLISQKVTSTIISKSFGNVLITLISFMCISCGQNSHEKTLNGSWNEIDVESSIENKDLTWHFYSDSLLIESDIIDKVIWKATESTIEFEYPMFNPSGANKTGYEQDLILINYRMSFKNDSLIGTLRNKFGTHKFGLVRAEKDYQFEN